jgi:hypothetical protein
MKDPLSGCVVLDIDLDLIRHRNSFKAPSARQTSISLVQDLTKVSLHSISPKLLSQQSLVESEQSPNSQTYKTMGSTNILPIKKIEIE